MASRRVSAATTAPHAAGGSKNSAVPRASAISTEITATRRASAGSTPGPSCARAAVAAPRLCVVWSTVDPAM